MLEIILTVFLVAAIITTGIIAFHVLVTFLTNAVYLDATRDDEE